MSSSPIQYVFFDAGGVVLNFKAGFDALSSALSRPRAAIEQSYMRHAQIAERGVIGIDEFWTRVRRDLKIGNDETAVDCEMCWLGSFVPIPQTHRLMRDISNRYRIGLLSNTEFGVIEYALEKGLIPAIPFANIIKSCDIGAAKPERRLYEVAQEKAGVPGTAILFVDDRAENVRAAEELGWRGIVFDTADPDQSIRAIRAALD